MRKDLIRLLNAIDQAQTDLYTANQDLAEDAEIQAKERVLLTLAQSLDTQAIVSELEAA